MNAEIEERREILNKQYLAALNAGLCKNKKEFSAIIGRNYTTIIAAMNGNETECRSLLVDLINDRLIKLGAIKEPIHSVDYVHKETDTHTVLPSIPNIQDEDTTCAILRELKQLNARMDRIAIALENMSNTQQKL